MIETIVILIWMHFIADFVLQSDKMANSKSSSNKWLLIHVSIYTLPFFWFGWQFAVINGVAHFMTDFVTARATSYLWKKEERHWFFVVIGLDQALHMTALMLSYHYLIGF